MKNEADEIDKAIQNISILYRNTSDGRENKPNEKNILNMMMDNVSELREYYVISKQQARKSFQQHFLYAFWNFYLCVRNNYIYYI